MPGEGLHQQAQHGLQGVRHPQLQRARRPREDLGATRERRIEKSGKENEIELRNSLFSTNAKFILSTWLSNKYRTNEYIFSVWEECFIAIKEHYYHIGGKEENRNAIFEALLSNFNLKDSISNQELRDRIVRKKSRLTTQKKEKLAIYQPTLFDEITLPNPVGKNNQS